MSQDPQPDLDPRELLENAPKGPGVYQFMNKAGEVLYVGKARNLKNRLRTYFGRSDADPKVRAMVGHVTGVDLILTHTEGEALLLESNLIKMHRPRYNIVLRDDKSYPYIRLEDNHPFPRLCFYRGGRREPGQYFGPYASAHAVRQTLSQLQKLFRVRLCEDTFYRLRSRPCLQFQIDRCTAPCVGLISEKDYSEDIGQAKLFLEGRDSTLGDYLVDKMEQSAAMQNYEAAATYRDRIKALRRILEHQYVSVGDGDRDVIALCTEQGQFCVDVTFIRAGRHSGNKTFFPRPALNESPGQVVEGFLGQFYTDKMVPREVIVSPAPENRTIVESALSKLAKRRVRLIVNPRGIKARVSKQAMNNARAGLSARILGHQAQIERLEALREFLDLPEIPRRIECFDASHTSGGNTVVSCVVFDTEGARKSDYRRFNIKNGAGDDYGALTEAIQRRFRRIQEGEGQSPDVLLIDGGKGQVKAAYSALAELQIDGIVILGIAKGPDRKPGRERIYMPGSPQALPVAGNSPSMHYIQQIRDEAHRFAITGHRQQRAKSSRKSQLQEIPGIGSAKRQALLKHLGGLQEVSRAGIEDLASVPGISKRLAERVYTYFHD